MSDLMKKIIVFISIVIIAISFIIIKLNIRNISNNKNLPVTSIKPEFTHAFENYLSDNNNKAYFFKVQIPDYYMGYLTNNEPGDTSIMSYTTKRENGKTTAYTLDDGDKSVSIEYTLYNNFDKLNKEYIKDNNFEEVIRKNGWI